MSSFTPSASCVNINCTIAGHVMPTKPALGDTAICRRCFAFLEYGRLFVSNLMKFNDNVIEMGEWREMWMLLTEGDDE